MPSRRGRPTRLDLDVVKRICAHLEVGLPLKYALESEGISERTGHEWIGKGEAGEEPFAAFSAATTRARARGVLFLHRKSLRGGKGADSARFVLERRFREYAPLNRIEHAGHDGGPIITSSTVHVDLAAAAAIRGDSQATQALHDALGLAVAAADAEAK